MKCMECVNTLVQIIFYIFSTVGILVSVYTYRRSVKQKKAEWLSDLSEKFYEGITYKKIRKILDYELIRNQTTVSTQKNPEYQSLKIITKKVFNNQTLSAEELELLEEFVDYMNFFEFIGSIESLKLLQLKEISSMFGYYLEIMDKDWIKDYLKNDKFSLTLYLIEKNKKILPKIKK